MGIESYEYSPGQINMIEGGNGQGKTSLLRAIQGVVGGGHDGTLLRAGQDKGEVVLVFDNGMTLKKEVRSDKSKVTLTDKEGKPVVKAASFIKEIVDGVGLNPVQLLTAPPKERIKMLLATIPMELPVAEIKKATGLSVDSSDPRHPLAVIEETRKKIFDDRTETNREIKEKTVYVDKMREAVPFKKPEGGFKKQLDAVVEEKRGVEVSMGDKLEAARIVMDREIENAKIETQAEIASLNERLRNDIDSFRKAHDDEVAAVRSEHESKLEALAGKEAVAREAVLNEDKALKAIEYVSEGEKEIETLKQTALEFTENIQALDRLKSGMLAKLPIDGLEVKGEDIQLDGIPFDSVNESRRIRFALTVAGMRDSKLPLVCVDGLEALDGESKEIFIKEAKKTDKQFFVTSVSEQKELRNYPLCASMEA